GELLTGQVGTGQLEVLVELGLVDVDRTGLGLGPPGLELLERVLPELVDLAAARRIVIGSHWVTPVVVRVACEQRPSGRICAHRRGSVRRGRNPPRRGGRGRLPCRSNGPPQRRAGIRLAIPLCAREGRGSRPQEVCHVLDELGWDPEWAALAAGR